MKHILLRPRAVRGIDHSSHKDKMRIFEAIEFLRYGKFPSHTKKLIDSINGYRTRVGCWRILFIASDNAIDIVDIFLRKESSDYRRH